LNRKIAPQWQMLYEQKYMLKLIFSLILMMSQSCVLMRD